MKLVLSTPGRVRLTLRSIRCFGRIWVLATGGRAHLGACSVSSGGKVRTYCRSGHRDDIVTEAFANRLAAVGLPSLAAGGIHYDDITLNEIETVIRLADEGADAIINVYHNGHVDGGERK